jgi:hypothetical protein
MNASTTLGAASFGFALLFTGDAKSWMDPGVLTALIVGGGALATALVNVYLRRLDLDGISEREREKSEQAKREREWDIEDRRETARALAELNEQKALEVALKVQVEADRLEGATLRQHEMVLDRIRETQDINLKALDAANNFHERLNAVTEGKRAALDHVEEVVEDNNSLLRKMKPKPGNPRK